MIINKFFYKHMKTYSHSLQNNQEAENLEKNVAIFVKT